MEKCQKKENSISIQQPADFASCLVICNKKKYRHFCLEIFWLFLFEFDIINFTWLFLDMETECYPCIPMHSASNQKRMNHSTVTMIKPEPLSEDVNVVVDEPEFSSSSHRNSSRKTRNRRSLIAANNNSQQQHRIHQHTIRLSRVRIFTFVVLNDGTLETFVDSFLPLENSFRFLLILLHCKYEEFARIQKNF